MRLQTILKPNPQICNVKELYFHEDDSFLCADGFFNLFYIEKRKVYTALERLWLQVRLKGWSELVLMHDRNEIRREQLEAADTRDYQFEFPYAETKTGVFWFKLKKAEETTDQERMIEGYYDGISLVCNPVNIAVDICTYRREDYVLRNMRSICSMLFADRELEVREHLRVMLIDNGNTLLENPALRELLEQEPRIAVYPNKNAGGAGGFTRGMLEAINYNETCREMSGKADNGGAAATADVRGTGNEKTVQEKAHEVAHNGSAWQAITHVLLMDDDAVFDPDLFVRLYGFLTQLREEHRRLTVGGGLMREDYPHLQYACGERFQDFAVQNLYPLRDMRKYENVVSAEMQRPVYPEGTYSGWWCCCYSMETIRRDNLPVPLFIHHDDIEYGLRNQDTGIVFLNGVCVWHRGFELTFTGVNRYYDVRNALITTALYDWKKNRWDVLRYVWKSMTGMLISYRYAETEFSCQGLFDFCKGPKWLWKQEPEVLNNGLRAKMKLEPYKALESRIGKVKYQAVLQEIEDYTENFSEQQIIDRYDTAKTTGTIKKKLTFNGWILPGKRHLGGKIKLISAAEPPFETYRERQVVLFEPFTRKAMLAKRSYRELLRMIKLYGTAFHAVVCGYLPAAKAYRKEIGKITSYESWRKYLDI